MTGTRSAEILRQLEQPGADDRVLLTRFVLHSDQAAFSELVRRHGPLVWAACQRVVGHRQDAEDAFQAVFLVLSRRATAISSPDLLGNWLYGVAVHVAMKARRSVARRRRREVQVLTMPDPPAPQGLHQLGDLGPVLDEALAQLSVKYREAIVLCDLQSVSRAEAAKILGIPEGTLSSRLANGRKKLAARLARRGVALSAAAIPGVLGQAAKATVPVELVMKACEALSGAVPAAVARLANGGHSMTAKLFFGVVGAAVAAMGAVLAARPAEDPPKPTPPVTQPMLAKLAPQPEAKPVTEPKADGKPAFTTPRLWKGIDLSVTNVSAVAWSPNGKLLAFKGDVRHLGNLRDRIVIDGIILEPKGIYTDVAVGKSSRLLGITPDNKFVITDLREHNLVSGFHQLRYTPVVKPSRPGDGGAAFSPRDESDETEGVNLEARNCIGYAFAPDYKTFRTILADPDKNTGRTDSLVVASVDATTGKTLKSLMKLQGDFKQYVLSPDGTRLGLLEPKRGVEVYDIDTAKQLWMKALKYEKIQPGSLDMTFSPDGKRIAVLGDPANPLLFDASTGDPLPKLERAEYLSVYNSSFSSDGRLLALSGSSRVVFVANNAGDLETVYRSQGVDFLGVWDTDTGKLLKKWDHQGRFQFHPSKPLLAIVEPNGDKTRLGLWDFSSDPEKK
jgi:RNA polymerase sigma factor (sigma-70 family)